MNYPNSLPAASRLSLTTKGIPLCFEKGNQISGTFSNFQVKGVGTYTPGEDAGGNAPDKEEYVDALYYFAYIKLCVDEDPAENVCISKIAMVYLEYLKAYYNRIK